MDLEIMMADPAGNRTAIVRTPVPGELRARTAAKILAVSSLRAEQVGFETRPRMGGAGRLEMMGGEFCGNAARSYGYLLAAEQEPFMERPGESAAAPIRVSYAGESPAASYGSFSGEGRTGSREAMNRSSERSAERELFIEISGHAGLLQVRCDLAREASFAEMPMPQRLERSEEGYPMVISEGITHMILQDMEPSTALVRSLTERYGSRYEAFGMMFLRGDRLVPVVFVAATGSLVYESSCGSGSLAAAWYLEREKEENAGTASGSRTAAKKAAPGILYTFQEPGGEILVRLKREETGRLRGSMGGRIRIGDPVSLSL